MSREIKFRAWDVQLQQMFYIFGISADGKVLGANGHGAWEEKTHDFAVMQFTGLKDKNGMEIYEGDILDGYLYNQMGSYSPKKCSVFWNVNRAEFACEVPGDDETCWSIGKNCSVLGNIYENPDLLAPIDK